MRILVLGGTRFIGPFVVRRLVAAGHDVSVFHRGRTQAELPAAVARLYGDRARLPALRDVFARLAPDLVLDLSAMTEGDAQAAVAVFSGLARRVVVVSSQDVYRAYDRFTGRDPGPPDPVPYAEHAPLRAQPFPYRAYAAGPDDLRYHYDKVLVERVYQGAPALAATVLRLPQVYGPGDYQHRLFPYLKRMDDRRPAILLEAGKAAWRWTRGYVENVAAAVACAVEDERAAGQVFNVGEAAPLTEAAWIRRLGAFVGWRGRLVSLPAGWPGGAAAGTDWRQHLVADTRKIRAELAFREPVALAEALRRAVAWERSHPPEAVDPAAFDYAAEDAALAALGRAPS